MSFPDQGDEADAGCDDRRGDLRAHERNLVQLAAPGARRPPSGVTRVLLVRVPVRPGKGPGPVHPDRRRLRSELLCTGSRLTLPAPRRAGSRPAWCRISASALTVADGRRECWLVDGDVGPSRGDDYVAVNGYTAYPFG